MDLALASKLKLVILAKILDCAQSLKIVFTIITAHVMKEVIAHAKNWEPALQ
jgi:hypothetical protein